MKQPILSIVIPTKDRYYYLEILLNKLFTYNNKEIEIVIQDNTDDNSEFLDFLKGVDYPLLKYGYTKGQIPIYQNADDAILNSTGKYICFIGDDDGVTSKILDCVEYMDNNNIDVMVPRKVRYRWPDRHIGNKIMDNASTIEVEGDSGKIEIVSSYETIKNVLKIGCVHMGKLPQPYHGIVRREYYEMIYKKCGTHFPGPSPDIASAMALALLNPVYAFAEIPVIIAGASKHHNGGAHNMKSNASEIDKIPFLPQNAAKDWEKMIPKIWTGETIWCESAVKALRHMGRTDLVEKVNYEYLYAKFITYHFPLRKMAWDLSNHKLKLCLRVIELYFIRLFKVSKRLVALKSGKIASGIGNINEAICWVENNYAIDNAFDLPINPNNTSVY